MNPVRLICAAMVMVLMSAVHCYSADMVFVYSAKAATGSEGQQIETAAKFYGVNLKSIDVSSSDDRTLQEIFNTKNTVGLVIAPSALAEDSARLFHLLQSVRRNTLPVLIPGITETLDRTLLEAWTDGVVSGCQSLDNSKPTHYQFGEVSGITAQLSGMPLPGESKAGIFLQVNRASNLETILNLERDGGTLPVFGEISTKNFELFLACEIRPLKVEKSDNDIVNAFLPISPAVMFVKYSVGEAGWHAPHHYANLTIDDPWLREPYGYVSYAGLLSEMENHDFHTTIAFIPWNYDRSQAGVVSLFQKYPDRFSIVVHGDNHDHKEFTQYGSKPLDSQLAAMRQSLARMEKFQELTGIAYERIMVFPHSIAPLQTLGALRNANYLATVNAVNVPQGEKKPSSDLSDLRPETLSFAGIPSISRQSIAEPITPAFLAVNAYLDNPMFFYGHSEDFAKGIGAFDDVADQVNKVQPGTEWRSPREIVEHLYLIKRAVNSGSDFDLLSFTNNFRIENSIDHDATFYVQKEEAGAPATASLFVEGQAQSYQLDGGHLRFTVHVPKKSSRYIAIKYGNEPELSSIGIGRDSLTIYLLRMSSDFRDIYLSKSKTGLAFVRFYNEYEITPTELLLAGTLLGLLLIFAAYRLRIFINFNRRFRTGNALVKASK